MERVEYRASGAERPVPFRAVWRILATPDSSELPIGGNADAVSLRSSKSRNSQFRGHRACSSSRPGALG
jgi:hypothetical protein